MEYKEYGSKNNDIIILLHGGGLSWWNYIDEISLLENEFHIVSSSLAFPYTGA